MTNPDAPTKVEGAPLGVPLGDDTEAPVSFQPLSEPLPKGASIGRYLVLGVLGEGGMGRVYSAYDPQLDRKVALKVILPGTHALAHDRLLREARAMAKLAHPNVVMVLDAGTFGAQVFVAMELIDGYTLRTWMKETPRDTYEILRVFRQAGQGLAAAHAAGLVHRDFKPANLLIGKDGRVCVTDFGLARSFGPAEATVPGMTGVAPALSRKGTDALTEAGSVVGTPHYMAPEQFLGGEIDGRADQFAFCVALWEAIYEEPPFPAESMEDKARRVTSGDLAEPLKKSQAPAWLYTVLKKGLSSRSEWRFESMDALLLALKRDDRKSRRRNLLLGVLAALVLSLGAGWVRLAGTRARACQELAERTDEAWTPALRVKGRQAFEQAHGAAGGAAWLKVEELLDVFANSWRETEKAVCAEAAGRGPFPDARLYAQLQCLDERRAALAAFAVALPAAGSTHHEAIEGALSLSGPRSCIDAVALPKTQQRAHNQLRLQLVEIGVLLTLARPAEAEVQALAATKAAASAGLAGDEADGWLRVSGARSMQSKYAEAEEAVVKALLIGEQQGNAQLQADAWVERLILAALHQQRFAEALEWAAHARAFLGRGARDALVEGRLEAGVGVALLGLGDRDGALAAERRALALDESELGPNHITLTRSLTAQGNILRTLGRYDEALAAHRRSMKIREALLDDTHPGLAISYNGLGRVLLAMGKVDEAIEEHEKAKRLLFGGDLSASPLESAKTLAMLGEALRAKGDHARALAEWSDALERVSPLLTPSHPMRATLQRDVARAAIATGDPTRAATAFGAAVEGAWPVAEKTALTLEWAQTLLRTRAWKPAIDALGALEGAEAHWVRAQAWRELKDPAKSTREAQAAIQAFTAQADEARAAEVQSWLKPAKVTRRKR